MHKSQTHLTIRKQPTHVWYKDVGGKKACIDFVVALEGDVRSHSLSLSLEKKKNAIFDDRTFWTTYTTFSM